MTYAYDEKYLSDAMKNLGEAFDYAVNACNIGITAFADLFISTGIAECFGDGHPKYVSGMSGTELVMEIAKKANLCIDFPELHADYDYSVEYWCGWILAYYQWKSNKRFRDILSKLSAEEICKLYHPLHEASEEKFVDIADEIIEKRSVGTKLQNQRKICGYSQKELSQKTGVNLRTLQQYEVGTKQLDKASVSTVMALANALGCKIEDILD